ncbi:MAG TPA: hypothetical protein VGM05_12495 [Planctomycetaceae bacterium]|jgi:hypothetical protein
MRTRIATGLSLPVVLLIWNVGHARFRDNWSYDKLAKSADVVAIATIKSTVKGGEPFDKGRSAVPEIDGQLSTFTVKAIVKGKVLGKELQLVHYKVSDVALKPIEKDGTVTYPYIVNGPHFPAFRSGKVRVAISTEDGCHDEDANLEPPHYLLFLKARNDGMFEPVSGQFDSALSVMMLRPEETPDDETDFAPGTIADWCVKFGDWKLGIKECNTENAMRTSVFLGPFELETGLSRYVLASIAAGILAAVVGVAAWLIQGRRKAAPN